MHVYSSFGAFGSTGKRVSVVELVLSQRETYTVRVSVVVKRVDGVKEDVRAASCVVTKRKRGRILFIVCCE